MVEGGNGAPAAAAVEALNCPSCGGTIELKAAGYTVTVVCQYCSSVLDVANPDVRIITEYHEAAASLEIPLGSRGTLDGIEWEAIGYMARSENGSYPWEEYLLFNPYHGYRWLVTDGRGWSFGEMLTRTPKWEPPSHLAVDNKPYTAFFADTPAQVDYVLGEFYWRVAVGEEVVGSTYVRPGWMLSREANGSEINWTLLRLLEPGEMEAAFGVDEPPRSSPPLPHQPSPYHGSIGKVAALGFGAIGLLVILFIIFSGGGTLLREEMTLPQNGQFQSATFGPVTLDDAYQAVSIQARAPALDNAWVDLDYALVNRATQVSYQAYGLAERYSGRDSEGSWTEGDRGSSIKMATVPAGTYDLVVEAAATRWKTGSTASRSGGSPPETGPIEVEIVAGTGKSFFSNVVLAAFLILIPLIFMFFRHAAFETARVAESDFAATGEDDEEDDE